MAIAEYFKHNAPVKMIFTERLADGICYTNNERHVRDNCRRLHIDLKEMDLEPKSLDIHRYNHFIVYTAKMDGKLTQHVFSTSANKRSVEKIVEPFPKEAAKLLLEEGEFLERNFSFE